MSRAVKWTAQIVPNGGIDETKSPQDIDPKRWTSGDNMEPMSDGVRRRLGSTAENAAKPLQLINISFEGGVDRRELTDTSAEYISQGFTVGGSAITVRRVGVRMVRTGSDTPAGNIHAAIYGNDVGGGEGEPLAVVTGLDFGDFSTVVPEI